MLKLGHGRQDGAEPAAVQPSQESHRVAAAGYCRLLCRQARGERLFQEESAGFTRIYDCRLEAGHGLEFPGWRVRC